MIRINIASTLVCLPFLSFCCLLPAEELSMKPGSPVDCSHIVIYPDRWRDSGTDQQLIPWSGNQVVFLTTQRDLDCQIMARFLSRLDEGWMLYGELTGRQPRLFKQLEGKPTITAVPEGKLTCGYGCGYVGATGIEVAGFYSRDYPLFKSRAQAMPHYYFYEIGRNFYTFGHRHSSFTTGFAVFMRYVCMDLLACEDPDSKTRKTIEAAEQLYAKSSMGFLKAFTTLDGLGEKAPRLKSKDGKSIHPSDQPVLYASAMLKLRRECGGEIWLRQFFRQLVDCPAIAPKSKEAALRQSLNWLVSASCAANRDLSGIFVDRWRLPLAPKMRQALSEVVWTDPDLTASKILKQLPRDTP